MVQKRKRREYRQMRKEQFKRPEAGLSMYEGRTRGKRIKYTFSDDEDFNSDSTGNRRSARNTGANTPAETGPVTTSSGRQIRAPPRLNMAVGDGAAGNLQGDQSGIGDDDSSAQPERSRRSAARQVANGWSKNHSQLDGTDEESEADFGDDEDDKDAHIPIEESEDDDEFDEEEAMVDDDLQADQQSLVVKLSLTPPKLRTALIPIQRATNSSPTPNDQGMKAEVDAETSRQRMIEMDDPSAAETFPNDSEQVGKGHPSQSDEMEVVQNQADVLDKPDSIMAQGFPEVSSMALAFRGSPEKD